MMYPFMTLDDNTEIVHSEMLPERKVRVYIEKPDERDCFHNATCYLPDYEWKDINGYTRDEIARYQEVLESTVSQECPTANATKIWITKAGRCLLCNNNTKMP